MKCYGFRSAHIYDCCFFALPVAVVLAPPIATEFVYLSFLQTIYPYGNYFQECCIRSALILVVCDIVLFLLEDWLKGIVII